MKVQCILWAGFNEHVPLHHLTNKKMKEAAYMPIPPAPGLQLVGQHLQLALMGLKAEGECELTTELWIECSANLVCSMQEHLHAGTVPCPRGITANTIADIFASHFEHIYDAVDFVSNLPLYKKYNICIQICWLTMSDKINTRHWQSTVWDQVKED
ncbi:hypothetical protein H0H87_000535 [Tephrocybe sp. NHM501043]|nr:hypothetical protein H0H87_000535 [Tephrocybe sp. NHM501043]